ncbi:glycosyltransferase family 2 protein [Kitasatospora sp. MAP5-34]|uniref:glycosyltransferase family 2 protein n=1 Tax=Kitasatospora sp. MAP5-34 TaxID=3035102 RepID=UPI00247561EC|nr:glycosyltransferase family 2 protein [Kitasatospora sp. MAP5-34]MDH6576150.1 N-acetylglucosaminyl-diphospho-decaprenol L-rhamnosyltransferase [Kitasatospora sp. MAP5-34]
MRSAKVAVVVVTWNSAEVLPGLLASLEQGLQGVEWSLTVADNASADETLTVVQSSVPSAGLIQTGYNAGYAAAINSALAQLEPCTAVLILNPDVRLAPGCVATMLAQLDEPGTGVVVPRLESESGVLAHSLRREPALLRAFGEALLGNRRAGRYPRLGELVTAEDAYRTTTTADWATGAALLLSWDCVTACGPWDESYFLYSEETEYALRARDLGFRTRLAPEARAVHLEGDSEVSPRLWTLLTLNKVRLYRRRHSLAAATLFWAATLLRELSRGLLGHHRSRRAAAALLSPSRLRTRPTAENLV